VNKPALKFQVETGVSVPSRAQENPYPFDTMAIGDSFLIPNEGESDSERAVNWNRAYANVQNCFRTWRMSDPKKRERLILTTRALDDGLRCWLHKRPW
jgi:hypothetical protein